MQALQRQPNLRRLHKHNAAYKPIWFEKLHWTKLFKTVICSFKTEPNVTKKIEQYYQIQSKSGKAEITKSKSIKILGRGKI